MKHIRHNFEYINELNEQIKRKKERIKKDIQETILDVPPECINLDCSDPYEFQIRKKYCIEYEELIDARIKAREQGFDLYSIWNNENEIKNGYQYSGVLLYFKETNNNGDE